MSRSTFALINRIASRISLVLFSNEMRVGCSIFICVVVAEPVGADPDLPDFASSECPRLEALNATTRHYFNKSLRQIVSIPQYSERLAKVGLAAPVKLEEFRLLDTRSDSAICQKLNELNNQTSAMRFMVQDRELGGYKPSLFGVYFEIRDTYVAIFSAYNSGSDVKGQLGPPNAGSISLTAYEKSNLNRIGNIGF